MLRTRSRDDSRGHSILCSRSLLNQQDMERLVTNAKIKRIYILYYHYSDLHLILRTSTICKLNQNHKIPLPLNHFQRQTISYHFHRCYNIPFHQKLRLAPSQAHLTILQGQYPPHFHRPLSCQFLCCRLLFHLPLLPRQ